MGGGKLSSRTAKLGSAHNLRLRAAKRFAKRLQTARDAIGLQADGRAAEVEAKRRAICVETAVVKRAAGAAIKAVGNANRKAPNHRLGQRLWFGQCHQRFGKGTLSGVHRP